MNESLSIPYKASKRSAKKIVVALLFIMLYILRFVALNIPGSLTGTGTLI